MAFALPRSSGPDAPPQDLPRDIDVYQAETACPMQIASQMEAMESLRLDPHWARCRGDLAMHPYVSVGVLRAAPVPFEYGDDLRMARSYDQTLQYVVPLAVVVTRERGAVIRLLSASVHPDVRPAEAVLPIIAHLQRIAVALRQRLAASVRFDDDATSDFLCAQGFSPDSRNPTSADARLHRLVWSGEEVTQP